MWWHQATLTSNLGALVELALPVPRQPDLACLRQARLAHLEVEVEVEVGHKQHGNSGTTWVVGVHTTCVAVQICGAGVAAKPPEPTGSQKIAHCRRNNTTNARSLCQATT